MRASRAIGRFGGGAAVSLAFAIGCHARGTFELDAGTVPFVTAPHSAFPRLAPHGGQVLARPHLVTVTFPGFAVTDAVRSFGDAIVRSQWLLDVGRDYGVGAGEHTAQVELPEPAPAELSDVQLEALLNRHIDDHLLPSPKAVPDLLYMVYLPDGTSITANGLGASCDRYDGYHHGAAHGARYAYAVMPDCHRGLAYLLAVAEHELIEAATDPQLDGWSLDVGQPDPWSLLGGSEVGDLCVSALPSSEGPLPAIAVWSDAAAQAGGSPCAPWTGASYVNVSATPAAIQSAPPGGSVELEVTGWSSTRVPGGWRISVSPGLQLSHSAFDPGGTLSGDRIDNGARVKLTLTVPASARPGDLGMTLVCSDDACAQFWPVAVQAEP